jgi:DNA-binding transcriptional regulator YdaS (Cro superfamily)
MQGIDLSRFAMAADFRKRAFARAAEILGGWQELADYLGTNVEQVQRWARFAKPLPPVQVLERVAQVLSHELTKDGNAKSRSRKS